jgi:hypothetical protein
VGQSGALEDIEKDCRVQKSDRRRRGGKGRKRGKKKKTRKRLEIDRILPLLLPSFSSFFLPRFGRMSACITA